MILGLTVVTGWVLACFMICATSSYIAFLICEAIKSEEENLHRRYFKGTSYNKDEDLDL